MKAFQVSILAADRPFYIGPCESLIFPSVNGQYGILADHSNMITAIVPGKLTWRVPGGKDEVAAVSAGLAKMGKNEVLILVDSIERPEEIDANRAKREADEAREAILQKKSIEEYRSAQASLLRAMNRLRVKQEHINL
ncbi:MAG: ATP synthase F1 subunit epsilon [Eubacteriales bacterium]|nr:ATP synthase F1 subunit epsilon [Eubacteriales bacterium]